MMRFFEMFSKRVVKIAGKCGPIKRIKANQLERIGELVPRVSLKIPKKLTSCLASQMERGNFYQTNATTTTTLLSFICMAIYVVTVLQKL